MRTLWLTIVSGNNNLASICKMKHALSSLLIFLSFQITSSFAQIKDSVMIISDSLPEIRLQTFNYNKGWIQIPASLYLLDTNKLKQISNYSFLPSMNSIPGVRMEERSPESYRLSIRGSLLRSPFGVRNMKVYWNGLPISDGGGNTYLNLLDISQLSSIEVAKDAGASMYGAGKKGLLLLESKLNNTKTPTNTISAGLFGGYYGTQQENASWGYQGKNMTSKLMISHHQSDGYRTESASHKDNITWIGSIKKDNHQVDIITFYTHLFYQTPGGISIDSMLKNPKLSRPAVGKLPSAVQAHSAIDNSTAFAGIHHVYRMTENWSSDIALVINHTDYKNPFITDYETRNETNYNADVKFIYHQKIKNADLKWISGGEMLANHSVIEDYGNVNGLPDTVQFKDNIYSNQSFIFTQLQLVIGKWTIETGISANDESYRYKRLTDGSTNYTYKQSVNFDPRLSIGYRFKPSLLFYGVVSKGYSAPSIAELRPSSRIFNTALQAEYGWNSELGIKGGLLNHRLLFDVNYYHLHLQQAIIAHTNTDGSQSFINAGNTKQDGFEVYLQYHLLKQPFGIIKGINVSESYSYQPYRFLNYQLGNNNYSGNHLTGVPENVSVTNLSVVFKKGYYLNISYNKVSSIPLTDANDVYAKAYHLLECRTGWKFNCCKTNIEIFAGGNNLLNELYSLGNDINAAGKRFYNPSPPINFFGGIKMDL